MAQVSERGVSQNEAQAGWDAGKVVRSAIYEHWEQEGDKTWLMLYTGLTHVQCVEKFAEAFPAAFTHMDEVFVITRDVNSDGTEGPPMRHRVTRKVVHNITPIRGG